MSSESTLRDHVFIIGLPKTGTKLMKNILENSRNVHCVISPETYFVGRFVSPGVRHEMHKIGDMSDDGNVKIFVEAMYSSRFRGTYWRNLASGNLGIKREDLFQAMIDSDRSDKSIYETLMNSLPGVTKTSIVGDKTPAHLYHVPTLIRWFPQAKFIHTFRDPRAIYASQFRKHLVREPWQNTIPGKPGGRLYQLSLLLHVTVTWMTAVRLHFKYQRRYQENYFLSRFETLVSEPETSVMKLCEFLGIEIEPAMLQPRQTGSSFSSGSRCRGFNSEPLTRWHEYIDPWVDSWFRLWLGRSMRKFGYL